MISQHPMVSDMQLAGFTHQTMHMDFVCAYTCTWLILYQS